MTDDAVLARASWQDDALRVLGAGGAAVALHVRGPGLTGRALFDRLEALLDAARRSGAALIVNDRVDVALALPVAGVQLRESSLPVADARRLLGGERWIGASVHDGGRARDAETEGADYLVVGTLFATRSHPDRAGGGAELISRIQAVSRLPLVAIGGVTPDRVRAAREAGAYGVAVLSGVWGAPDPAGPVDAYLAALAG